MEDVGDLQDMQTEIAVDSSGLYEPRRLSLRTKSLVLKRPVARSDGVPQAMAFQMQKYRTRLGVEVAKAKLRADPWVLQAGRRGV